MPQHLYFDPDHDPLLLLWSGEPVGPCLGLHHPLAPFQAGTFLPPLSAWFCHSMVPDSTIPSPAAAADPRCWVWVQACLCKPSMVRSIYFSGKLKVLTTRGAWWYGDTW